SMIAKLVVWAPDRSQALARMGRALDEYVIEGVPTTLPLLRELCGHPEVQNARYGTATLEQYVAGRFDTSTAPESDPAALGAIVETLRIEVNGKLFTVRVLPDGQAASRRAPRVKANKGGDAMHGNDVLSPMHGAVVEIGVSPGAQVTEGQVVAVIEAMKMMNEVRAHKAGTASRVHVSAGETVEARAPIVTIE
ncbi:MAG: acetyl-/propionyl-CoA carboxylase subunit alpha, partial [Candidatus Eremiobacteraeota bacterium]|nr:acetyl-/propionyl-CoA carboxylase subunit alpha [Candidatus Eremiobacteraeota bacterium]